MSELWKAVTIGQPTKRWKTGDCWGCWKLQLSNRTLQKTTSPWYEIDLDRCRTSAAVLDWICQIVGKRWATNDVIADLARALNDLLKPQQTMCSWAMIGRNSELAPIDIKKTLKELHY